MQKQIPILEEKELQRASLPLSQDANDPSQQQEFLDLGCDDSEENEQIMMPQPSLHDQPQSDDDAHKKRQNRLSGGNPRKVWQCMVNK